MVLACITPASAQETGAQETGAHETGAHETSAQKSGAHEITSPAEAIPPPQEVTVRAARKELGGYELGAEEASRVPGTFGDPLRAVETLPGVAATGSGIPYFYVRGSPPANTGYFLDGVPVPMLFHLGPGASIVAPGTLERTEFYPAAPSARYGRFTGGVIAAETKTFVETPSLQYGAKMFEANAVLQTPWGGGDGSVLVGGRYGYPNLLLSLFAPDLSLQYWDYTARATRKLSAHDSVTLFAFGAKDQLRDRSGADWQDLYATEFHRVDLRYDHSMGDGNLRLATTYGHDVVGQVSSQGDVTGAESTTSVRVRVEYEDRPADHIALRAGGEMRSERVSFDQAPEREGSSDRTRPPRVEPLAGAYLEVPLVPVAPLDLIPGVRADVLPMGGTGRLAIDPRVATRLRVHRKTRLLAQLALLHQPPTSLLPAQGGRGDDGQGLQRTYQSALGVETELPLHMVLKVTGFLNRHENMTDYVPSCSSTATECNAVQRVSGASYGSEFFLKKAFTDIWSGWLSYTLSRASRRGDDGRSFLSPFDRPHALSAVLSVDLGQQYRVGARGTFLAGRPDTPELQGGGRDTQGVQPTVYEQHRLPSFYRLDIRAEKRWLLSDTQYVTLVFEFFNTLLKKEATDFRCDTHGLCTSHTIGPLALPSIGIEGAL